MADEVNPLRHIFVSDSTTAIGYTSPLTVRGKKFSAPQRQRAQHAAALIASFASLREQETVHIESQHVIGLDVENGMYLTFESDPEFELKFESLDLKASGIELCAIKREENRMLATVFVPEGKISILLRKVEAYANVEKDSAKGRPANADLVDSINNISGAVIQALWTDEPELFPDSGDEVWWEVWLRVSSKIDTERFLRDHAEAMGFDIKGESIHFLDRTVVLVKGTREVLAQSMSLIPLFAELRAPKTTALFFTEMDAEEQGEWVDDLLSRLNITEGTLPALCLLDTGLTSAHPLISPLTGADDQYSYNHAWGTQDDQGHGTNMAGIAGYGDLTDVLGTGLPIAITHVLESVKIIPQPGTTNDPDLYGAITKDGVAQPEITKPDRLRVYCMAVTSTEGRDRGRPSSWSATIDAISSGYDDGQRRLMILAAGNVESAGSDYPERNLSESIHDPGQSWNALTVGAYTRKIYIDPQDHQGYQPVADLCDLAPSSTTSLTWDEKNWPNKPDVVFEGGNMGVAPDGFISEIDSLSTLTTSHRPQEKLLVPFGDTSNATAEVARLATSLLASYPTMLPETIRGLIVHSACWTDTMLARFPPNNQPNKRNLLRCYGYGVPNEHEMFWSAANDLTLIAEDSLQPFVKVGSSVKTRDLNIHTLPWPTEVLQELGETPVEMKVTLSYFIEPNPGERGWKTKFQYQSHGLRFDVRRSLESTEEFRQRINKEARDEGEKFFYTTESGNWVLGNNFRRQGCIHSDTWSGTAVQLAERGYVAIYPVGGWWKQRPALERWGNQARYSLMISIKAAEVEADLYTEITNQIETAVEIEM